MVLDPTIAKKEENVISKLHKLSASLCLSLPVAAAMTCAKKESKPLSTCRSSPLILPAHGAKSETIGSLASPNPASGPSPSSPPHFAQRPPRPQSRSPTFVVVEPDEVGETDPSAAAGNKVTNLESAYAIATIFDDSDSEGGATSEIIDSESECDFGFKAR
ncbi:hypothetical protein Cgig2_025878 [Carnegiea gigantea]|uniref:Uncharacterized protein n=1 Tax=Carnegiea gigantea TaxID=171969 RepID=A0A9Q1JG65_9CARY|nr:hypothetical protein Cgig2_025878 [Carnegiea gigantea]